MGSWGVRSPGSLIDTAGTHEAAGIVTEFNPEPDAEKAQLPIAGYYPKIEGNRITGLEYGVQGMDTNNLKTGGLAISLASDRCRTHLTQVNPATGFPDACPRDDKDGHEEKMVPGRAHELPGHLVNTEKGLLFPSRLLVGAPPETEKWVQERPQNLFLLSQVEPLSCWQEALRKELPNPDGVKTVLLIGDGLNTALGVLYMKYAFPDAKFVVVGRTDKKLDVIAKAAPGRVKTIKTEDFTPNNGYHYVERELMGDKFDLVIPTIHVDTLKPFDNITKPDGGVIIWAAGQTDEDHRHVFKGVGDENRLHASYGNVAGSEFVAMQFFDALVRYDRDALNSVAEYPFWIAESLEDAVGPLGKLLSTGKFSTRLGDELRPTSRKVLIKTAPAEVANLYDHGNTGMVYSAGMPPSGSMGLEG